MKGVIKSLSTIHDIYHRAMGTAAVKTNVEKETACFNMYFSLQEIYNNNKTKSENTMILRV